MVSFSKARHDFALTKQEPSQIFQNLHLGGYCQVSRGGLEGIKCNADFTIMECAAGKISGFIASIPQVIVAALLVFMWTMLAAMGLSNLRYSETGSSRNVLIVGLSLFLSLSIPSYFQQYDSSSSSTLPSYFQPYNVAAHGPIHTSSKPVSYTN
jgi:hypothetical protein